MVAKLNHDLLVNVRSKRGVAGDHIDPKQDFPIVIAYNDFAAGTQAMRLYQLLAAKFGDDFQFRISLWNFGVLCETDLLQTAITDAVNARVVIIAIHGENELSAPAREWIDSWTRHRPHHGALLALLDGAKFHSASPTEIYLKDAAAAANMDFLIQIFELAPGEGPIGTGRSPLVPPPTPGSSTPLNKKF
jgi:hypothetical protein